MTIRVYVVVVVGVTAMLASLRFGTAKSNPGIVGVMVAAIALVYLPLSSAVCHEVIVGVDVVSEQVGSGLIVDVTVPVQV